jgi:predicted TIM-barrel fold metal-dependent hydrolase
VRVIAVEEHFLNARVVDAPYREDIKQKLLDVGERRIADMDAAGIDVQVVSHASPGAQSLDPAEAVALVREENDWLAEQVGRHPDRLAAFAALPSADPRAAAGELERAVRQLGLKGAVINGPTGGRFLDDQLFWPILECAESLEVPIYVHPAPPMAAVAEAYYGGFSPQVSAALATNAWGWHIETGVHLLRLILAGVFDRFPKLQVVAGHLGEALPFMLRRATGLLAQAVTGLQRPLPEYFCENLHLTTSGFFSVPPFLNVLLEVGADRIMFAVDYPFSPNERGQAFLETMPVSPADKEKIAHGNAERLLRLAP